jgi:drug/metabolite transporter (DMT)-like permease
MRISKDIVESDGLLLLTAIIWGLAFSAQRSGMDHIGPFAYNGIRFALGTCCLLPLVYARRRAAARAAAAQGAAPGASAEAGHSGRPGLARPSRAALAPLVAGSVMFVGSSLQQTGLVYTTAANAGFITSLYVVIVPLIGVFFGRKSGARVWIGSILAAVGLYVLSVGSGFVMAPGDILELIGAFFWALHILVIGRFAATMDPIELAAGQFAVCSVLSLVAALVLEPDPFAGAIAAAIPILYAGILSTGLAFTLQIVAQRKAHPAHASIIMSMEALFASLGGVLILGEELTLRLAAGGGLMLAALVVAQLESGPKRAVGPG